MSAAHTENAVESVVVWDRAAGKPVEERIYGDAALRALYGTAPGRFLADHVLSARWFSRIAGAYYGSRRSARGVPRFVRDFDIPMDEFEPGPFTTFNDFFVRRFRDGARVFTGDPDAMPAFAESRLLAWDVVPLDARVPVKGASLAPEAIAGDGSGIDPAPYAGGPAFVARLCPVDYHRYHYPDDGTTVRARRVAGRLHSVHPFALRRRPDVLCTNERRVAELRTERFGPLLYVEIGAMNVGRIVQTHDETLPYARGDEKGKFLFGASSIVVLGQPGRWTPDADLVRRTRDGVETLVRLGEPIATRTATAGS